jgi:hypothetical protein
MTTYLSLNGLEVSWPHVLASIYTESLDTNVDQVVEKICNLAAYILFTMVKIIHAAQVAVANLVIVSLIHNLMTICKQAVVLC